MVSQVVRVLTNQNLVMCIQDNGKMVKNMGMEQKLVVQAFTKDNGTRA